MERVAAPLRRMGVEVETTDGHAPIVIEGGPAEADRVRAAGRERAGEVGGPARRALRASGETTVDEPLPTRDHTEHMLDAGGRRRSRRKPRTRRGLRRPSGSSCGELEIPGDFSSAAPFLVAATLLAGSELTRARRQPQPAPHRPARRARADGRPHHRLQPAADRRRAGGDLDVRSAELVGDDDRRGGGAAARRRAAALRAARGARARRQRPHAARRSCARRRPTGSRPSSTALRSARRAHPRDRRTASRCAACRRGCAAARSTPAATTGSRCSARSPGSSRAKACEVEGAECGGGKLPRLLRPSRLAARRHFLMIVAIDGPAGAGKSTVARLLAERLGFRYLDTGAMYRALTWLARRRGLALDRADELAELAVENPVAFDEAGRVFIDGSDVTASIRKPDIDKLVPVVARHHEVREVMRERQRALGRERQRRHRGPRHRHRRRTSSSGKGLPPRRPDGPGRTPLVGAAGDRRRRARDRPAAARREGRGQHAPGRGRGPDRHDRRSRSTRSSR